MKRLETINSSAMGREVVLRFSRGTFDDLARHLTQDPHIEQFAFGLFSQARTPEGTVLTVRDLFLPGPDDLIEQSAGGVAPTRAYQTALYVVAQQRGMGIVDAHTHTHPGTPHFSGVDQGRSAENAEYICRKFPAPITHAMVVFGNDMIGQDVVVYDRSLQGYRSIDQVQVLGRGSELRLGNGQVLADKDHAQYDRQSRIPGWNQATLARTRAAVVGMGGNGAHVHQALVCMGVGTEGWLAVIDPDVVEASNRPRIPYATPDDTGQPKVTVGAQYGRNKNPAVRIYPYPCSLTEVAAIDRIKGATVLFGCGDGDGVRKVCNELAVRYQIPYIDLGCDIQVDEDKVDAGGQVRVVLPGQNGCLVCCGGYDPAAAATELMDDARKAVHAARGYVIGDRAQTTASVASLNATVAQLGIAAFLALIHGPRFGKWDYAHYDQLTAETLTATSSRNDECPLCGPEGSLAVGDAAQGDAPLSEPSFVRLETAP